MSARQKLPRCPECGAAADAYAVYLGNGAWGAEVSCRNCKYTYTGGVLHGSRPR